MLVEEKSKQEIQLTNKNDDIVMNEDFNAGKKEEEEGEGGDGDASDDYKEEESFTDSQFGAYVENLWKRVTEGLGGGSRYSLDVELSDDVAMINSQCVGLGFDPSIIVAAKKEKVATISTARSGKVAVAPNCIFFVPQLGYNVISSSSNNNINNNISILERMTLMFLKLSMTIVRSNYSIVYASSSHGVFTQAKAFKRLYKMLPRCYKKNLSSVYVIRPSMKLRAGFKVSKLFFGSKVASKFRFLNSIAEFQSLVSPLWLKLPSAFLQLEDSQHYTRLNRTLPDMKTLDALYDDTLGAPLFVVECVDYLRSHAMHREGLFRVPGDQTILSMSIRRFRISNNKKLSCIIIGKSDWNTGDEGERCRGSGGSSGGPLEEERERGTSPLTPRPCAAVVVEDVDEVAQLLKAYFREFPSRVVTDEAYKTLLMKIREREKELRGDTATATGSSSFASSPGSGAAEDMWAALVELELERCLPRSHWKTLEYILDFLSDLASQSQINKMTPDNISIVFAPVLMSIDMSSPTCALENIAISQKIVRMLLMRRMEISLKLSMSSRLSSMRVDFSRYSRSTEDI